MEQEAETLSADVKIRMSPTMLDNVRLAASRWPVAPGQRPITPAEWIRIAIMEALHR